jgi:hypothetical protein
LAIAFSFRALCLLSFCGRCQFGGRALMHLGRLSWFAGMTDITILDCPGHFTIVTGTAVLTIDNFEHIDLVTPGFHFESEIRMTNLASKTNAMKPVWKNNRAHPGRIGVIVNQHVTILGTNHRRFR